jgi:hypothetical protein
MFMDVFHIQMQLMQRLDQWNEYVCMYPVGGEVPPKRQSRPNILHGLNLISSEHRSDLFYLDVLLTIRMSLIIPNDINF